MKTNYTTKMSPESEAVLSKIADYAAGNMMKTKNKALLYSRIITRCTSMIGTSLPSS
jgi:hypothetical protein